MKIDDSHRPLAIATGSILVVSALLYAVYAAFYPGGPRGNTLPGLIFGVLGYAMILFAGFLSGRKKLRLWRIGRVQHWMRGHLWLGGLSLFMILFHSGFMARGPLTRVLLGLLVIVVGSGFMGAAIQHFVPRLMMSRVELETIFEQIPHVREKLRAEAQDIVDSLCREPEEVLIAAELGSARFIPAVAEEDEAPSLDDAQRENLRHVYNNDILPFIRVPDSFESRLSRAGTAAPFFEALRRQMPSFVHGSIRALEDICEEQRQLTRQRRLYYWLYGWQLIHVPLSVSLVVLGLIHAIIAVRY